MNKFFLLLVVILFKSTLAPAQTSLDGTEINLSSFSGKKLLYVVVPEQNDTSLIHQIERFQKQFRGVRVIAIVKPGTSGQVARSRMSKAMDSGMIVTAGIAARTQDSPQRESVMEWISEKRRTSSESEQKEAGSKYFISEDGRLYAMLGPDMSLDHPLISAIVNAVVPKAIYQEDPSLSPEQIKTIDR